MTSEQQPTEAERVAALHKEAAADYAAYRTRSEPQLPPLSPELTALAAEADALAETDDDLDVQP